MTNARAGVSMRLDLTQMRFGRQRVGGALPGSSCLDDRIVEVRRLLRTEKSVQKIADEMGVDWQTLRSFIKRRAICNMRARIEFITLQRSLAKLDAKGGST